MASLDAALAGMLARTGAQAARVVDGRSGTVVAEVGPAADDDAATLVALVRDAQPVAAPGGDVVVATRSAVHVLRAAEVPGTFLHVRLAHGQGDLARARRELASIPVPLPRPAEPVPLRAALDQRWMCDDRTLRRVVAGLRALP